MTTNKRIPLKYYWADMQSRFVTANEDRIFCYVLLVRVVHNIEPRLIIS